MITTARQLKDLIRNLSLKNGRQSSPAAVFDEVEENPVMEKLWHSYQKNFSYAADLSWHTIMDSVKALYAVGGSV